MVNKINLKYNFIHFLKLDNICYVVNVGDSRAILSIDSGKELKVLSNDHKPNDPSEKKRIIEGGGKVYQYVNYILFFIKTLIILEPKLQLKILI